MIDNTIKKSNIQENINLKNLINVSDTVHVQNSTLSSENIQNSQNQNNPKNAIQQLLSKDLLEELKSNKEVENEKIELKPNDKILEENEEDQNCMDFNFNMNPFNTSEINDIDITHKEDENSDNDDLILEEKEITNELYTLSHFINNSNETNNTTNIPRVLSGPLYINNNPNINSIFNSENIGSNNDNNLNRNSYNPMNKNSSFNNSQNMNNANYFHLNHNIYTMNNDNLRKQINFLNNSFTMNGKSGWICSYCKNFNYKSKYLIYNFLF